MMIGTKSSINSSLLTSILICIICLLVFMPQNGVGFSDYLIVEEGRSQLITVESESKSESATVEILTLHDYKLLSGEKSRNFQECNHTKLNIISSPHGMHYLSESQLTLLDVDTAEVVDFEKTYFDIKFESGFASFYLGVHDDHVYESQEFCVMVIDDGERCAILLQILDNDELAFNWNVQNLNVHEDDGLVSNRLSITKIGNNEHPISLQIRVVVKDENYEAQEGVDFNLPNTSFSFESETPNISVPIIIQNDTVMLNPKHFYLTFYPESRIDFTTVTNQVKIYILNRIKFLSEPHNITTELGETVTFPCSIAQEGSTLPHWMLEFSNRSIIEFDALSDPDMVPANHLVTGNGLNVTIKDVNLNLTSYTCFFVVLIPAPPPQNVDTENYYSQSGILTITPYQVIFSMEILLDSNVTKKIHSRTGETFDFVIRMSESRANYTFNVTIVSPEVIEVNQTSFIFTPTVDEFIVEAVISDRLQLNVTTNFTISIVEPVEVINQDENNSALIADTGAPIQVVVYANQFFVGFDEEQFKLTSEMPRHNVCVSIAETDEIDPVLELQFKINLTSDGVGLNLDKDTITLNVTNRMACISVEADVDQCIKSTSTIQLISTTDPKYGVIFFQQSTVVNYSCISNTRAKIVTIFIYILYSILVILMLIIIITICIVLFYYVFKKMSTVRWNPTTITDGTNEQNNQVFNTSINYESDDNNL